MPWPWSPSPLARSLVLETRRDADRPTDRAIEPLTRCTFIRFAPGTLGWHAVVNRFTAAFSSCPFPQRTPSRPTRPACWLPLSWLARRLSAACCCTSPPSSPPSPFPPPRLPGLVPSPPSLCDAMPATAAARCARRAEGEVENGPTEGGKCCFCLPTWLATTAENWVLLSLGVSQADRPCREKGGRTCVSAHPTSQRFPE